MNRATDVIDYGLLFVGSWWSLSNIEHILGIVILAIQLAWLLTKLIVKIVKTIRSNKNLDNHNEDIEAVVDILEEVQEVIKIDKEKEDGKRTKQK